VVTDVEKSPVWTFGDGFVTLDLEHGGVVITQAGMLRTHIWIGLNNAQDLQDALNYALNYLHDQSETSALVGTSLRGEV